MSDYPDYTRAQQIIGSNIQVPIDIQGAYIMMPVDIQAQYITLSIDIVAQTIGNIAVNIAAQTAGNITVNIAAQSLSNLNINLNAQAVAIMYGGEWGAKQGTNKSVVVVGSSLTYGAAYYANYTVTAGKTLFVNSLGFFAAAAAAADGDKPQHAVVYLFNWTHTVIMGIIGGSGGGAITYPSPLTFPAGEVVRIELDGYANHTMVGYAGWQGWEM
jgi:hypothetical protein